MTIANATSLTWHWLEELANCSETQEPNSEGVTRFCATPEHRRALSMLSSYMYDSGMDVRKDNAGNLIGRYTCANPKAKTLIFGSHQDTVPNGGKYDGALGITLPIALVHYFNRHRLDLPFNIDVIAFSDEEGTRFQSTLFGSKAVAGRPNIALLDHTDSNGITLQQALGEMGCKPEDIEKCAYNPETVIGFVETHIEQGPVLDNEDLSVAVVTGITGLERHVITISGETHKLNSPNLDSKQDALVGAAQVISILNSICKHDFELKGVVGKISNFPNGVNVIPQRTEITIELRCSDDEKRQQTSQRLFSEINQAMEELNLSIHSELLYEQKAVTCSPQLSDKMAAAIESHDLPVRKLFSDAGHDALTMSHLTDIAMLFVRCKDGITHHPKESITTADIRVALEVLERFVLNLASE